MILDLIFFGVIALCAALGFIFGFFKTIISFLGWFICILFSFLLAKAIANAFLGAQTINRLVGEGSLFDLVYGVVPDKLKSISLEQIREGIAAGENVKELVRSQMDGFMVFASSIIEGAICKDMYLNSAIENAGQVLALELTYHIYVIMVGIIIFLLLRVIVMMLSFLFKFRLGRKVKLWERLAGIGAGIVRGFAYACIIVMVASYVGGMSDIVKEETDASKVSVPVSTWVNDLTGKMLSGDLETNEHYQDMIDSLCTRFEKNAVI